MFDSRVVHNLNKFHSNTRALYSDVVKSVTPSVSVKVKRGLCTTHVHKCRVPCVNTINKVSGGDTKVYKRVKTSVKVHKPTDFVLKTQNKFQSLQDCSPVVPEDGKYVKNSVVNRSLGKKRKCYNADKGKTKLPSLNMGQGSDNPDIGQDIGDTNQKIFLF